MCTETIGGCRFSCCLSLGCTGRGFCVLLPHALPLTGGAAHNSVDQEMVLAHHSAKAVGLQDPTAMQLPRRHTSGRRELISSAPGPRRRLHGVRLNTDRAGRRVHLAPSSSHPVQYLNLCGGSLMGKTRVAPELLVQAQPSTPLAIAQRFILWYNRGIFCTPQRLFKQKGA